MKALTWKAVLATLNPSPVFEAVATFSEELTMTCKGRDRNKFTPDERDEHVTTTSANTR
jgi:hypothetical protein